MIDKRICEETVGKQDSSWMSVQLAKNACSGLKVPKADLDAKYVCGSMMIVT